MVFGIMLFILISLWSITTTLEKLTDKVLERQDKRNQLLEEINKKLDITISNKE
ncbi:hypothetical protein [Bacillus sp. AK128]